MKTKVARYKSLTCVLPMGSLLQSAWLAAAILCLSQPAMAQYSPPSAGLIGWWRGEGNGIDSAGGHNGTLLDGVSFDTGVSGQAFSFAGTHNRVYIPDSPDFKLTNSLSVGAWIYPKANSWAVLQRSGGLYGSNRYAFGMDDLGHVGLFLNYPGVDDQVIAPIPFNQWSQVTATLDGSTGDMRLYINGELVAQKHTTVRPLAEIDPADQPGIGIGNSPVTGGFPFIGLIDEVVLYSRALSAAEVGSLTNGVDFPPIITTQPANVLGYAGGTVTLTVGARGTPPLSYLWFKDGAPLITATSSSLVLSNLTTADEGTYAVVVSNPFGIVVSSNALVAVSPVGLSLGLYAGLTISGAVGATYGIQYATDLSPTATWTTITNLTLTQPVQIWCDTSVRVNAPGGQPRFYRVFQVPH